MNDRHDHADTSPDEARRRHRDEAEAAPPTQWSEDAGTRKAPELQRDRRSDVRSSPRAGNGAAGTGPWRSRRGRFRGPEEDAPGVPWKAILVAIAFVAALLAWGVYEHWRQNSQAAQTQARTTQFVPTVRTVVAKREDGPIETFLPGQSEAFQTANIFARATGYIAERRVDIGSRVKKGDLLVHIAAPDLDEQAAQAVAQLGQVEAALNQA